jgi:hypothetical protein
VQSVSHSFGISGVDEMTLAVSVHARWEIFSAIITILDRSHRYFEDINYNNAKFSIRCMRKKKERKAKSSASETGKSCTVERLLSAPLS